MSDNEMQGSSIFAFGKRLRLDAELREMRSNYRDAQTGQAHSRYIVTIVVSAEATGSQAVALQRCILHSARGDRIELAQFDEAAARVEPGQPPKRIAMDASQLWYHGAQRVDLVDNEGRRWALSRRKLRRLMHAYEDHAAAVDQMNAAEMFTQTWDHDDDAPNAAPPG